MRRAMPSISRHEEQSSFDVTTISVTAASGFPRAISPEAKALKAAALRHTFTITSQPAPLERARDPCSAGFISSPPASARADARGFERAREA